MSDCLFLCFPFEYFTHIGSLHFRWRVGLTQISIIYSLEAHCFKLWKYRTKLIFKNKTSAIHGLGDYYYMILSFSAHLSCKVNWAFSDRGRPAFVYLSIRLFVCKLIAFSTSSPWALGQFQPHFVQNILGCKIFKFVQMNGHAFSKGGGDNYELMKIRWRNFKIFF